MFGHRFLMMVAVSFAAVGCGGPLISHRIDEAIDSGATNHGSYCLPRILVGFTAMQNIDKADDIVEKGSKVSEVDSTIVYLEQIVVPDTTRMYRLEFLGSALSSDKVTVEYMGHQAEQPQSIQARFKTPANCLLRSIKTETDDRTPEIAKTLAETALRATTGSPGATIRGGETKQQRVVSLVLDVGPRTEAAEERRINEALAAAGFKISVSIRPALGKPFMPPAAELERRAVDGIFFITPWPYILALHPGPSNKVPAYNESMFYASADAPIEFISIDRSAFVKHKTSLTFNRGFPTEIDTDKPSEVEGFVSIPLDITTAIVKAPVEAFKAEKAETDAESDLRASQATLIQRQMDLLKKQNEMIDLLSKPKAAAPVTAPVTPEEIPGGGESAPE